MVLPKEIRGAIGLKEGDPLIITVEEGRAVLLTPEKYASSTRGMLKGTFGRTREEIKLYLQGERASWAEKARD